ncbi:hypothetical protein Bamb_4741 [Burkholderia ambifaria AMMD]|uniref:Uncharacterized protein n=1 Tax=Burkholderia ambifaria (strain ATCC BAA-244 / DSM 16087 / CCUG 44356 / LMG 19182 / AMMD) TaxID=339670 RepID=Q0B6D2_BURCM|nr:hypothetical protein Bamb_4741 [Burkholderia ambifaria AMMD]
MQGSNGCCEWSRRDRERSLSRQCGMRAKRNSRDGRARQLGFAMGGVKKMRPRPRRSHGDTDEVNVDMRGTIAADTAASVRLRVRE